MTTEEIIKAAKNTKITKEMIESLKLRLIEFDKKSEFKNQPMNTDQLNKVYSPID